MKGGPGSPHGSDTSPHPHQQSKPTQNSRPLKHLPSSRALPNIPLELQLQLTSASLDVATAADRATASHHDEDTLSLPLALLKADQLLTTYAAKINVTAALDRESDRGLDRGLNGAYDLFYGEEGSGTLGRRSCRNLVQALCHTAGCHSIQAQQHRQLAATVAALAKERRRDQKRAKTPEWRSAEIADEVAAFWRAQASAFEPRLKKRALVRTPKPVDFISDESGTQIQSQIQSHIQSQVRSQTRSQSESPLLSAAPANGHEQADKASGQPPKRQTSTGGITSKSKPKRADSRTRKRAKLETSELPVDTISGGLDAAELTAAAASAAFSVEEGSWESRDAFTALLETGLKRRLEDVAGSAGSITRDEHTSDVVRLMAAEANTSCSRNVSKSLIEISKQILQTVIFQVKDDRDSGGNLTDLMTPGKERAAPLLPPSASRRESVGVSDSQGDLSKRRRLHSPARSAAQATSGTEAAQGQRNKLARDDCEGQMLEGRRLERRLFIANSGLTPTPIQPVDDKTGAPLDDEGSDHDRAGDGVGDGTRRGAGSQEGENGQKGQTGGGLMVSIVSEMRRVFPDGVTHPLTHPYTLTHTLTNTLTDALPGLLAHPYRCTDRSCPYASRGSRQSLTSVEAERMAGSKACGDADRSRLFGRLRRRDEGRIAGDLAVRQNLRSEKVTASLLPALSPALSKGDYVNNSPLLTTLVLEKVSNPIHQPVNNTHTLTPTNSQAQALTRPHPRGIQRNEPHSQYFPYSQPPQRIGESPSQIFAPYLCVTCSIDREDELFYGCLALRESLTWVAALKALATHAVFRRRPQICLAPATRRRLAKMDSDAAKLRTEFVEASGAGLVDYFANLLLKFASPSDWLRRWTPPSNNIIFKLGPLPPDKSNHHLDPDLEAHQDNEGQPESAKPESEIKPKRETKPDSETKPQSRSKQSGSESKPESRSPTSTGPRLLWTEQVDLPELVRMQLGPLVNFGVTIGQGSSSGLLAAPVELLVFLARRTFRESALKGPTGAELRTARSNPFHALLARDESGGEMGTATATESGPTTGGASVALMSGVENGGRRTVAGGLTPTASLAKRSAASQGKGAAGEKAGEKGTAKARESSELREGEGGGGGGSGPGSLAISTPFGVLPLTFFTKLFPNFTNKALPPSLQTSLRLQLPGQRQLPLPLQLERERERMREDEKEEAPLFLVAVANVPAVLDAASSRRFAVLALGFLGTAVDLSSLSAPPAVPSALAPPDATSAANLPPNRGFEASSTDKTNDKESEQMLENEGANDVDTGERKGTEKEKEKEKEREKEKEKEKGGTEGKAVRRDNNNGSGTGGQARPFPRKRIDDGELLAGVGRLRLLDHSAFKLPLKPTLGRPGSNVYIPSGSSSAPPSASGASPAAAPTPTQTLIPASAKQGSQTTSMGQRGKGEGTHTGARNATKESMSATERYELGRKRLSGESAASETICHVTTLRFDGVGRRSYDIVWHPLEESHLFTIVCDSLSTPWHLANKTLKDGCGRDSALGSATREGDAHSRSLECLDWDDVAIRLRRRTAPFTSAKSALLCRAKFAQISAEICVLFPISNPENPAVKNAPSNSGTLSCAMSNGGELEKLRLGEVQEVGVNNTDIVEGAEGSGDEGSENDDLWILDEPIKVQTEPASETGPGPISTGCDPLSVPPIASAVTKSETTGDGESSAERESMMLTEAAQRLQLSRLIAVRESGNFVTPLFLHLMKCSVAAAKAQKTQGRIESGKKGVNESAGSAGLSEEGPSTSSPKRRMRRSSLGYESESESESVSKLKPKSKSKSETGPDLDIMKPPTRPENPQHPQNPQRPQQSSDPQIGAVLKREESSENKEKETENENEKAKEESVTKTKAKTKEETARPIDPYRESLTTLERNVDIDVAGTISWDSLELAPSERDYLIANGFEIPPIPFRGLSALRRGTSRLLRSFGRRLCAELHRTELLRLISVVNKISYSAGSPFCSLSNNVSNNGYNNNPGLATPWPQVLQQALITDKNFRQHLTSPTLAPLRDALQQQKTRGGVVAGKNVDAGEAMAEAIGEGGDSQPEGIPYALVDKLILASHASHKELLLSAAKTRTRLAQLAGLLSNTQGVNVTNTKGGETGEAQGSLSLDRTTEETLNGACAVLALDWLTPLRFTNSYGTPSLFLGSVASLADGLLAETASSRDVLDLPFHIARGERDVVLTLLTPTQPGPALALQPGASHRGKHPTGPGVGVEPSMSHSPHPHTQSPFPHPHTHPSVRVHGHGQGHGQPPLSAYGPQHGPYGGVRGGHYPGMGHGLPPAPNMMRPAGLPNMGMPPYQQRPGSNTPYQLQPPMGMGPGMGSGMGQGMGGPGMGAGMGQMYGPGYQSNFSATSPNQSGTVTPTWSQGLGPGNFGTGNFGTGNFGTGNFGTGNFGTGNFGTGNFGTGNFGTGNFGIGNFGTGIFGAESINNSSHPSVQHHQQQQYYRQHQQQQQLQQQQHGSSHGSHSPSGGPYGPGIFGHKGMTQPGYSSSGFNKQMGMNQLGHDQGNFNATGFSPLGPQQSGFMQPPFTMPGALTGGLPAYGPQGLMPPAFTQHYQVPSSATPTNMLGSPQTRSWPTPTSGQQQGSRQPQQQMNRSNIWPPNAQSSDNRNPYSNQQAKFGPSQNMWPAMTYMPTNNQQSMLPGHSTPTFPAFQPGPLPQTGSLSQSGGQEIHSSQANTPNAGQTQRPFQSSTEGPPHRPPQGSPQGTQEPWQRRP